MVVKQASVVPGFGALKLQTIEYAHDVKAFKALQPSWDVWGLNPFDEGDQVLIKRLQRNIRLEETKAPFVELFRLGI